MLTHAPSTGDQGGCRGARRGMAVSLGRAAGALALAALVCAGCASASAKTSDHPPLVVPPAPPRVIPAPPEPEPTPEPVADLPPVANPNTPRPPRPTPPKPENKGADTKPGEAKPPEPPPDTPATPVQPPPQLRPVESSGAETTARQTIDRAQRLLATVDYGPLSNDRKKAYNDAKMFIQQAEDALTAGNIVFAQGVATKAETLAKELAGK